MSGADIVARGLAVRALNDGPALFAELPSRAVAASVFRIETSGYGSPGSGAGTYVCDDLCTESLLAAHPRFVARTKSGRIFRLLGESGGLTVEHGGAVGDGVADDRAAIQAAIDYAAAVAIGEVRFQALTYRVHATLRTSPVMAQFAEDGHPLVIRKSVTLRGIGLQRSTLDFMGPAGEDPDTWYQVVPMTAEAGAAPGVWRGGGIFVRGDVDWSGPPPKLAVDRVEMHRINLRGNRSRTPMSGWPEAHWPADPATGDGWDDTDRALWMQDTHIGDVVLTDCDMIGWRGEIYYGAALTQRSLRIERCRLSHTNGNAFNPGTNCPLVARDCDFGDAFQAHEDTGKYSATYSNCRWFDAGSMVIGSGPANGLLYDYLYPTRDEARNPPVTLLDMCRIENIDRAQFGCWMRGKIKTVDTTVHLPTYLFHQLRDIEMEIDAWIDRRNGIEPLTISGPDTLTVPVANAPSGTYQTPPRNIRVCVRAMQTDLARRNNAHWAPVSWSGYVHHSVAIVMEDCSFSASPFAAGTQLSMPLLEMRNFRHSDTDNNPVNGARYRGDIAAATKLTPMGPEMCYSFTGGPHTITLAQIAPGGSEYGYAHGQRLRIYAVSDAVSPGQGLAFLKDEPFSGMRLREDRLLSKVSDCLELRFNRHYNQWEEVSFRTNDTTRYRVRLAGVAIPALDANQGTTLTQTVAKALPGDHISIAFSTLPATIMATAKVITAGQVRVSLFNIGASTTATTTEITLRGER